MRGKPSLVLILSAMLALSACGGNDGQSGLGEAPGGGIVNRAPTFTSAATAIVPENITGAFYTATATDPDNNAVTFSLSGGADRAAFAITSAGSLSFVQPPDFEAPADADQNNAYLVQVAASDGTTSTTLDLVVTVTNAGPDAFHVSRVGTGFASPVFLTAVPDGSGRVFVVERAGRIRILSPSTGAIAATPFLDATAQTTTDGERGLLGLALAPNFGTTGTFYIFITNLTGQIEIRRYNTLAGNRDQADPATADAILTIDHPGASNHNGGWLAFGPDGLLYMAVGDGGTGGANGQNLNTRLGKILRIDPSSDAFPADPARDYAIPPSNPFAAAGGLPEIWAYGLRNPFRNSFDVPTGNLWVGDVGEGAREEVDLLRSTDGGANLGWNIMEGTALNVGPTIPGLTAPVAEYLHGSGARQGNSITGGVVYRGPIEALNGHYIFGDFVSGNLWSIPIAQVVLGSTLGSDRFVLRRTQFTPNAGAIVNPVCFGFDQAGNVYIVDIGGSIFRIDAG